MPAVWVSSSDSPVPEALPDAEPFDQIGSAAWRSYLAAMLHETQYTRLFRT